MAISFRISRTRALSSEVIERGVLVAQKPHLLAEQPKKLRADVEKVAKAVVSAPNAALMNNSRRGGHRGPQPINITEVASRAASSLAPGSSTTPADIELALRRQGLDWVEPFSPGRPLVPFYGYDKRPRGMNYPVGRNITTDTRPDRIPFATLKQVIESYDVALTCIRHIINDLRSMPLRWNAMDNYDGDVKKEIEQAKTFWLRPDGKRHFNTWLAMLAMDKFRYDAGAVYRERNGAGKVIRLKVIDGTTLAPLLDYFGDVPEPPAPAYQQFVQGIPWDWLTTEDIIYEPMWPVPESPYGVAPIETVLTNANTDMRLQLFFLQFFTEGAVPEMLLEAPPDQSDPDALAEYQETWDDWMENNQGKRHGAQWIPAGAKPFVYKQIQQINPKIAEYVMRRTVAAFGLTPQDLGILDDVNRATSETQMDSQFRITTLPNTEHFEAMINAVTQEDLQLPVAASFDKGRESEDRLSEAEAHKIYVSIGAESPDEVREKVLGLPVDNESRIPRFFDNDKLGPIPLAYLVESSGKIDPKTLSPIDATVAPEPFIPAFGIREDVTPTTGEGMPSNPGPKPAASTPKPSAPTGHDPRSTKASDLTKWRKQSLARLQKGQKPREFADSAIDTKTYDRIWSSLEKASSLEEIDAAFTKVQEPICGGLAVRAGDTGRVLMLQRAHNSTDPASGLWEFPGGHVEPAESVSEAALREWEEETGLEVPDGLHKIGEWDSPNGLYRGFAVEIPHESDLDLKNRAEGTNPDGDTFESIAWWDPADLSNNPSVRPEVNAVSQLVQAAVAKSEGEPPPKAPSPRPGPWGHLEEEIVQHYLPMIRRGLKGILRPATLAKQWFAHHGSDPQAPPADIPAAAGAFIQGIKLDMDGLHEALGGAYTDALLAGSKDAADQITDAVGSLAEITHEIDWSNWKPGNPVAAHLLANKGFERILQEARIELKGIEDRIRTEIGQILEQSIYEGWNVDQTASEIDKLINNPNRAELIAVTEINRAMSLASHEFYRQNGIAEWNLITAPGACPKCLAIAAQNPHPMSDKRITPEHPRCRCAIAAHITP